MKVKVRDFISDVERYGIEIGHFRGRITLKGGNEKAREHYVELLVNSPEFEGALIWELAQTDADLMDFIEERRAMNWVYDGDDSVQTAIIRILGVSTASKGEKSVAVSA